MSDEFGALLGKAVDVFGDDALDVGKDVLGEIVGDDDAASVIDAVGGLADGRGAAALSRLLGDDAAGIGGDLLGAILGEEGAAEAIGLARDIADTEAGGALVDMVGGAVSDEVDTLLADGVDVVIDAVPDGQEIGHYMGPDVESDDPQLEALRQLFPATEDDLMPEDVTHDDGAWVDPEPQIAATPEVVAEPEPAAYSPPADDGFESSLAAADAYESSVDTLFEGA